MATNAQQEPQAYSGSHSLNRQTILRLEIQKINPGKFTEDNESIHQSRLTREQSKRPK